MKKLEVYFKQFEQLLQNIIKNGEIDEYDDGEVMLSIHQFEQDESKIAEIVSKNPGLKDFYNKPKPIQVVEKSEDGEDTFSEDMSLRILSEYLQDHSEFEFVTQEESSFSEYVVTRFKGIAEQIRLRLNNGMQIPWLDKNEDSSKRVSIGYMSYDMSKETFSLIMNNGKTEDMSQYDAMPLVFNYIYERRTLEHFRKTNNEKGISKIPLGYREPIKYKDMSQEINDDFIR